MIERAVEALLDYYRLDEYFEANDDRTRKCNNLQPRLDWRGSTGILAQSTAWGGRLVGPNSTSEKMHLIKVSISSAHS
jgi:hypothetical protein